MKILYYNWVDYLDDARQGGGVTVYQRNLIQALDAEETHDVMFLSAGMSYDLFGQAPRWAPVAHGPKTDRDRRFEIVNSGVMAPGHRSFGDQAQLSHAATRQAVFEFIEAKGPFDVIHFNNLEGLPADVLELKKRWPDTRLVLSLHNYYPFCPQVNLWQDEIRNCVDFEAGRRCGSCVVGRVNPRVLRLANAWAFFLKRCGIRQGTRLFDGLYGPPMRVARTVVGWLRRRAPRGRRGAAAVTSSPFAKRRQKMVGLINRHCDLVLCVSDRVRQIAEHHGVTGALLKTSYIGTAHARKFQETKPRALKASGGDVLQLGYLGYMRRDKGFFFLLEALATLPVEQAKNVGLTVAAGQSDSETMQKLEDLGKRLGNLIYVDGYSHDTLDGVLEGIDVGVIPVQWEDNLPQVAIEMHARHIPLLTSDLGGAQELSGYEDMIFRSDDVEDFHGKLAELITNGLAVQEYWNGATAPVLMNSHIEEILTLYGQNTTA